VFQDTLGAENFAMDHESPIMGNETQYVFASIVVDA